MRIFLIVLLVLSIFIVFTVPTFYEAHVEHTVLTVSREVASDLIWARSTSIKTGKDYGVVFIMGGEPGYHVFLDKNGNGKFDASDIVARTVEFKDINKHVKFSGAFDDKGVVFTDNTFIFRGDGKLDQTGTAGYDSVFIINDSDERKGIMERTIRVYVDRSNNDIQILMVTGKTDDGDIIFGEIIS